MIYRANAWLDASRASAEPMLLRVVAAFGVVALASALAMSIDVRTLDNGQSIWLKPLRFALAFGVHLLTLWWLARLTRRAEVGDRWFGVSAWLQVSMAVLELACIALQAARGRHSHFNYATPLDHAVFTVMGLGTAVLLVGIMLMVAGLARWPAGRVPTVGAIAGLSIAVLGGLVGVWMVMPTADQRVLIDAGQRLPWVGSALSATASHETLPFFGWDLRSGDWRVPHFLGLHALQAVPLLAWLHLRRSPYSSAVPAALWVGTAAYLAAFLGAVAWTARGNSILDGSLASVLVTGLPLILFIAVAFRLGCQRGPCHVRE